MNYMPFKRAVAWQSKDSSFRPFDHRRYPKVKVYFASASVWLTDQSTSIDWSMQWPPFRKTDTLATKSRYMGGVDRLFVAEPKVMTNWPTDRFSCSLLF